MSPQAKRLIGGPFDGAEVNRGSASLLLSGDAVSEGQVARYRFSAGADAYVFKGMDIVVLQIPSEAPEGRETR